MTPDELHNLALHLHALAPYDLADALEASPVEDQGGAGTR